jgi:ADP-ribose pyrophosphatase YjhB (NUDIX family)
MPSLGVNIAIIENDRVLLTRREDFEVWCLPGGAVDPGESIAQAAVREAREETGLEVHLTRLVGLYSWPNWHAEGTHAVVFAARPVGGELHIPPVEVLEARYFSLQELPEPVLFGQSRRIKDALLGVSGAVYSRLDAVWPFETEMTRSELYDLRDRSGLSRQQFYLKFFGPIGTEGEQLEVG